MNTPTKNQGQPSGNTDNEMPSSTKEKFAHENAGPKDIIGGYKEAPGEDRIGASIMSPAKIIVNLEPLSRDPFKANANGMTLSPERVREGGDGGTVAVALNAIWTANDAQRERKINDDAKKYVVEKVLIGQETMAKTKAFVAAMTDSMAATRVPLDADDHQYVKKASLLQADFDCTYGHDEEQRWSQVMGPYAPSANSFYIMRPAICWQKRRELAETLRQITALDISSEMGVLNDLMKQLAQQKKTLNLLEQLKRSDVLKTTGGKTRRPKSLRNDLSALPAGWQMKILERAQASEIYADAVAILALTGCRPEELAQGVKVRLDAEPAVIHIKGAKLGDHAGQPWRKIDIPTAKLPAHMLLCLREERDFVEVKVDSTDALRQALYSYSRELWPGSIPISPYHFRHSMAETLRENGWPAHEIAAVLGERSAATVSHYGRKIRPKRAGRREVPEVVISRGGVRTAIKVPPLPVFDASSISVGINGKPAPSP
jgi:integrase